MIAKQNTRVQKSTMGRRSFLATAAGGLSIAFTLPDVGRVFGVQAATGPTAQQLSNAYINIGTDGAITLMFGGSEMGQGSKTGLAQILAEELMVDWNQVKVQQAKVDPLITYITGGSSAVSGRYSNLRIAGAAARESLIAAAMLSTGDTTRGAYTAASATVVYTNPSTSAKTSFAYKDLVVSAASAAAQALVPANLPLTDPGSFRIIGKPIQRVDIPSKVDGSAKFGIDTWFPNMVFAAIKHCPVIGGTLGATPTKPSGAIAVVPCKATDNRGIVVAGTVNAVAVVASNTWSAKNMANSLSVSWKLPASTASVDSAQLASQAAALLTGSGQALTAEPPAPAGTSPLTQTSLVEPSVLAALGTPTVDATYSVPYLAHATMEVLNCTVRLTYDATKTYVTLCEIWVPTQAASWVVGTALNFINALQSANPLSAANVVVNTTFLGGGLGRKIEQDYVGQAVQVALAVKVPVKLTWMREEDMTHDNYRPMGVVNVKATLSSGAISAWYVRTVSSPILGQRGWIPPGAVDSQAVEGAVGLPYSLPTRIVEWVPLNAGIPVGFWRSVGSSINTFAVECTIDELSQIAGMDPFDFRLSLISDSRTVAVINAARQMSSWRTSLAAGHFWGMAIAEWNGTIVCEVVEISMPTTTSLRVHRVACAVDCGTVINPNQVEAQMQGGIVHGINATLYGQITFTAGKANQKNFNNYRMIRPSEMPQVTVQTVQSGASPSGIGEPAVPPVAPAIANALSRLRGTRVRSLPIFPGSVMGGL